MFTSNLLTTIGSYFCADNYIPVPTCTTYGANRKEKAHVVRKGSFKKGHFCKSMGSVTGNLYRVEPFPRAGTRGGL